MHWRTFGENLMKIGLILSAQQENCNLNWKAAITKDTGYGGSKASHAGAKLEGEYGEGGVN
jgi:hypothetical protein